MRPLEAGNNKSICPRQLLEATHGVRMTPWTPFSLRPMLAKKSTVLSIWMTISETKQRSSNVSGTPSLERLRDLIKSPTSF